MRLIDADLLKEDLSKFYDGWMTARELIDSQPTVELLKEKQPRVLTFEEVINHYSVPEEIKDDFDKRIDYQMDIEPLYWDFPIGNADSFIVHWRGFESIGSYIERWKPDYGLSWRCWSAKPTDEQRKAVPWKDGDGE